MRLKFPSYFFSFNKKNIYIVTIFVAMILIPFYFTNSKNSIERKITAKQIAELIKKENYKKVIDYINDENMSLEDTAYFHFLVGRAYQEEKSNYKALASYSKAISKNPKFYKAFINRGLVKGALKDYQGSIKDMQMAISINPKLPEPYLNIGVTQASLNKPIDAIENFIYAISINPKYINAYRNLGITYFYQDQKELACLNWQKAINLGENSIKDWKKEYCK